MYDSNDVAQPIIHTNNNLKCTCESFMVDGVCDGEGNAPVSVRETETIHLSQW